MVHFKSIFTLKERSLIISLSLILRAIIIKIIVWTFYFQMIRNEVQPKDIYNFLSILKYILVIEDETKRKKVIKFEFEPLISSGITSNNI